jgi:hypothetical protein
METESFLEGYSQQVQSAFLATTQAILEIMPDATQQVDTAANLIAFTLKPGYKGTVFTLMPAKAHVTLGIYNGATLDDPAHLMTGSGKVHRHIKIAHPDELRSEAFKTLLQIAVQKAQERLS